MNKSKNLSNIIKITLLTQALVACSFHSNTNLLSDTQNLPNPSAKSESQDSTKIKSQQKDEAALTHSQQTNSHQTEKTPAINTLPIQQPPSQNISPNPAPPKKQPPVIPQAKPRNLAPAKFAEKFTKEDIKKAEELKGHTKSIREVTLDFYKDLQPIERLSVNYLGFQFSIDDPAQNPEDLDKFLNFNLMADGKIKPNSFIPESEQNIEVVLKKPQEFLGYEDVKRYIKSGKVMTYNQYYSSLERESHLSYQLFDTQDKLIAQEQEAPIKLYFSGNFTKQNSLPSKDIIHYSGAALAGDVIDKIGMKEIIHGDFSFKFDFATRKGSGTITNLLDQPILLNEGELPVGQDIMIGTASIENGLPNPKFDKSKPVDEIDNPEKLTDFSYYASFRGPNAEEISGNVVDNVNYDDVVGFIGQNKE